MERGKWTLYLGKDTLILSTLQGGETTLRWKDFGEEELAFESSCAKNPCEGQRTATGSCGSCFKHNKMGVQRSEV